MALIPTWLVGSADACDDEQCINSLVETPQNNEEQQWMSRLNNDICIANISSCHARLLRGCYVIATIKIQICTTIWKGDAQRDWLDMMTKQRLYRVALYGNHNNDVDDNDCKKWCMEQFYQTLDSLRSAVLCWSVHTECGKRTNWLFSCYLNRIRMMKLRQTRWMLAKIQKKLKLGSLRCFIYRLNIKINCTATLKYVISLTPVCRVWHFSTRSPVCKKKFLLFSIVYFE